MQKLVFRTLPVRDLTAHGGSSGLSGKAEALVLSEAP